MRSPQAQDPGVAPVRLTETVMLRIEPELKALVSRDARARRVSMAFVIRELLLSIYGHELSTDFITVLTPAQPLTSKHAPVSSYTPHPATNALNSTRDSIEDMELKPEPNQNLNQEAEP